MPDESVTVAEARERLSAVLEGADPGALTAWAAAGLSGLRVLRAHLDEPNQIGSPDAPGSPEVMERIAAAIAATAEADPDQFLSTFSAPRWRISAGVVTGLGVIDHPAATRRLLEALRDGDRGVRCDAAIGLGNRSGADVVRGLTRSLDDDEALVRFHALRSMARVGDPSTGDALRLHGEREDVPAVEHDLAGAALQIIEERRRLGDDVGGQVRLALTIGDLAGVRRLLGDSVLWPHTVVPGEAMTLLEMAEEVGDPTTLAVLRQANERTRDADRS